MFNLRLKSSPKIDTAKLIISKEVWEQYAYVANVVDIYGLAKNKNTAHDVINNEINRFSLSHDFYHDKNKILNEIPELFHEEIQQLNKDNNIVYMIDKNNILNADYDSRFLHENEELFISTSVALAYIAKLIHQKIWKNNWKWPKWWWTSWRIEKAKELLWSLWLWKKALPNIAFEISENLLKRT